MYNKPNISSNLSFISKQFKVPIKVQQINEKQVISLKNFIDGDGNRENREESLANDNSLICLEYGKGNTIIYDFKTIEEELAKKLLMGKRTFDLSLRFIQYQLELYLGDNSSMLIDFKDKYVQKELDLRTKERLGNHTINLRSNELLDVHTSIEALILYLKNSQQYENTSLLSNVFESLPRTIYIPHELRHVVEKNDLKVEDLVGYYELVELFAFKYVKDFVALEFKKEPTELVNDSIDKFIKSEKQLNNDNLCTALRRFIQRYLIGDLNDKQPLGPYLKWKLDIWPKEVTEDILNEFDQLFPVCILVGHSWNLLKKLGGLEEKQKVVAKEQKRSEILISSAKISGAEKKNNFEKNKERNMKRY